MVVGRVGRGVVCGYVGGVVSGMATWSRYRGLGNSRKRLWRRGGSTSAGSGDMVGITL